MYISSCSRKAWTAHESKEKLLLCQTDDFALMHLFFSPWKNYCSYDMPAFDSSPPGSTEGTKLPWICGLIWEFSSPGCAWLGADNSPLHFRTGESYTTTTVPFALAVLPPETCTCTCTAAPAWASQGKIWTYREKNAETNWRKDFLG